MEAPKKPTVHSMKRRSFVHEYSYRGFYHITISVAADLRQPLGRVCGNIDKADGEAASPHVELSPIGQMVEWELLHSIKRHYPMVEVDTYIIMPEHLHILFHVTRDIFNNARKRTHLGRVIAGFKQGCNRRYWEITGLIPTDKESQAIKSPGAIGAATAAQPSPADRPATSQAATTAPQLAPAAPYSACPTALGDSIAEHRPASSPTPLPSLFETGYCDVIPVDEAQLATQRAYIRNNPRSRLLRTSNRTLLMPRRGGIDTAVSLPAMCGFLQRVCPSHQFTPTIWQELQGHLLMEDSHITCDSYGDRSLLERRLLPVVCHRQDAARFNEQKTRSLEAAARGAILVSARIAKGEQEISDAALASGYSTVRIIDNGFPERYHPSATITDACAAGHLLLLSPWRYQFRRKDDAIHVPFCKAMNCIAQAVCRTADDWWKADIPRN